MRLLRGLGGKTLKCGCLVGVYETYDSKIVTVIDVRGERCPDPKHRRHARFEEDESTVSVGASSLGAKRGHRLGE
ncbi:MAG TPA: hypothetical protein VES67_03720 [Vicinamibacterales bacterium]|nr:hypothetical protein [Vicinamibacterales bacterium]